MKKRLDLAETQNINHEARQIQSEIEIKELQTQEI